MRDEGPNVGARARARLLRLTPAFGDDAGKRAQWTGFVRKAGMRDAGSLTSIIAAIAAFVERPLAVAASGEPWIASWSARGPWQE